MARNAEMEWSRQALLGLVFKLFALAALAERAAFAPRAIRRDMLAALRPGARHAQAFVLDAARAFGAEPDPAWVFDPFDEHAFSSGDSPDDAVLLGHCFRSLGWALQFLLAMVPADKQRGFTAELATTHRRAWPGLERGAERPPARIAPARRGDTAGSSLHAQFATGG